jgi:SAM-dependent methyltransferase
MSNDRFVDSPPAGADAWREVWQNDRRYPAGNAIRRLLASLVRRGAQADTDRQRDFNLAVLDILDGLRRDIEALRADLKHDLEAVQLDARMADEALAGEQAQVRELIPVAARRNDALIAALDQKIETLAVRMRDLTNPPVGNERGGSATRPAPTPDFIYRRLEDSLRGSEAEVRESLAYYAERAAGHAPLVDVGCGRGELLALCREAGVAARGFDTNERSVADLRQRGFEVALAGVPECFDALGDGAAGSVAALHVVEHLPVELLFAFFAQAARVLRSGGLLMIETPNAESLFMSASQFWRDPTHLAPRHPAALTVLAREHGFDVDEIVAVHPFPEGTAVGPEDLRDVLFAPQDLRAIFRRS